MKTLKNSTFHNAVFASKHPVVLHKISLLRSTKTGHALFRTLLLEVSRLLAYEASQFMPLEEVKLQTPISEGLFPMLKDSQPIIIPILRAGLGMQQGFLECFPNARVGYIGLKRNETTMQAQEYYLNLPKGFEDSTVFIIDPMLATGGSASYAINLLKDQHFKNIFLVNVLGTQEGIQCIHSQHPDVPIFIGCIDSDLNAQKYISPGLGDAGDRQFGTEG